MARTPTLAAHTRVLVALTQRASVREELSEAAIVLAEPGPRAEFLRLAGELGVEGLVLKALDATHLAGSLPAEAVRELDARRERLRQQALLWDLERDRVLHVLGRRGVSPLLLKGGALRERVYDDAIERSMGDLDVLVATDEIDRSVGALREAGYLPDREDRVEKYRLYHFHQVMHHPRGFIVELHWALTHPASIVPLNAPQFSCRASLSNRGSNTPVRVPSSEDLLLHVVSQNESDAFGMLRRIVDVDRIVASSPNLDWSYLVRAASDAALELVLAASLRLAQVLLRTEVPSNLSSGTGLPILSRLHLAMMDPVAWVVSLPGERRDVAIEAMRLWFATTWSARMRRAAELLRDEPMATVFHGTDERPRYRWGTADRRAVRATKLAVYHLLVYGRTGFALASSSGRRRLRFWG